jgi:hypothetical protein
MAREQLIATGRDVVWCGHSDGRVSELVVAPAGGGEAGPGVQLMRQFGAHRSAITAITITPAREIWTGSDHGTIRCWGLQHVGENPQRDSAAAKLGCAYFKPEPLCELEWPNSRGSEVRRVVTSKRDSSDLSSPPPHPPPTPRL